MVTSLEQAQAEVQAQESALAQAKAQAEAKKQETLRQQSKLPNVQSQQSLRASYSGIKGMIQRQNIQKVSNQLGQRVKDIDTYNNQLEEYNTKTLQPYKKQLSDYQNQLTTYTKQINEYKQGYQWGLNKTFVGNLTPTQQQGYQDAQKLVDSQIFNQKIQSKIDAINSGSQTIEQAFGDQYDALIKAGIIKVTPTPNIDKVVQNLPQNVKVNLASSTENKSIFSQDLFPLVSASNGTPSMTGRVISNQLVPPPLTQILPVVPNEFGGYSPIGVPMSVPKPTFTFGGSPAIPQSSLSSSNINPQTLKGIQSNVVSNQNVNNVVSGVSNGNSGGILGTIWTGISNLFGSASDFAAGNQAYIQQAQEYYSPQTNTFVSASSLGGQPTPSLTANLRQPTPEEQVKIDKAKEIGNQDIGQLVSGFVTKEVGNLYPKQSTITGGTFPVGGGIINIKSSTATLYQPDFGTQQYTFNPKTQRVEPNNPYKQVTLPPISYGTPSQIGAVAGVVPYALPHVFAIEQGVKFVNELTADNGNIGKATLGYVTKNPVGAGILLFGAGLKAIDLVPDKILRSSNLLNAPESKVIYGGEQISVNQIRNDINVARFSKVQSGEFDPFKVYIKQISKGTQKETEFFNTGLTVGNVVEKRYAGNIELNLPATEKLPVVKKLETFKGTYLQNAEGFSKEIMNYGDFIKVTELKPDQSGTVSLFKKYGNEYEPYDVRNINPPPKIELKSGIPKVQKVGIDVNIAPNEKLISKKYGGEFSITSQTSKNAQQGIINIAEQRNLNLDVVTSGARKGMVKITNPEGSFAFKKIVGQDIIYGTPKEADLNVKEVFGKNTIVKRYVSPAISRDITQGSQNTFVSLYVKPNSKFLNPIEEAKQFVGNTKQAGFNLMDEFKKITERIKNSQPKVVTASSNNPTLYEYPSYVGGGKGTKNLQTLDLSENVIVNPVEFKSIEFKPTSVNNYPLDITGGNLLKSNTGSNLVNLGGGVSNSEIPSISLKPIIRLSQLPNQTQVQNNISKNEFKFNERQLQQPQLKVNQKEQQLTRLNSNQVQLLQTRQVQKQQEKQQQRQEQKTQQTTTTTPPPLKPRVTKIPFTINLGEPKKSKLSRERVKDIYFALTKRKGKEIVLRAYKTPQEAFAKSETVALRTLARSVIVKNQFGQYVQLNQVPSWLRPSKKNPSIYIQKKALNRGTGEVPEILSAKRSKSVSLFKKGKRRK